MANEEKYSVFVNKDYLSKKKNKTDNSQAKDEDKDEDIEKILSFKEKDGYDERPILGPVPDSVRGYLAYCGFCGKWILKPVCSGDVRGIDVKDYSFRGDEKKLILILESPHRDEFKKDNIPILPAQGATGRNIEHHIGSRKFVDSLDKGTLYTVVLANAVQYQASLYAIFKREIDGCKEKVLKELLGRPKVKVDLERRLKQYVAGNDGNVIVNCSTKGIHKDVDGFLKSIKFNEKVCFDEDGHPFSWIGQQNKD